MAEVSNKEPMVVTMTASSIDMTPPTHEIRDSKTGEKVGEGWLSYDLERRQWVMTVGYASPTCTFSIGKVTDH